MHPSANKAIEEGNQSLRISMTEFVLLNAQSFLVVEEPSLRSVLEITFELG